MTQEMIEYCEKNAKEMYDEENRCDGLYNDDGDMYGSVPYEFFRGGFICAVNYIAQNGNKKLQLSGDDIAEILSIFNDILDHNKTIDRTDADIELEQCCNMTAEIFNKKA